MKWTRLITLVLILIASAFLYMWLILKGEISDLGLNAFTETLGILITVLIVDYLIQKREETRLLPQQAAAYEDVRLLTSRLVSFWIETYKSSVPGAAPKTLDELFSAESFDKICNNLNMDSQPNVIPRRTWWEWFPQNLTEFQTKSETILERHNSILDPEAYSAVHKLATHIMQPDMIATSRQIDRTSGFPRPKVLGSYWFPIEEYQEPILSLVSWCIHKEDTLKSSGLKNLKSVISKVTPWETQDSPECMIDENELQKQINAVEEFRKSNKTLKY
jgi:hypothetical protein